MALPTSRYSTQTIDESDIAAVRQVLTGDFLTQGPALERFEAALAERLGVKHVVSVSSGTAGLHIACLAAGLAAGSVGVTSAVSFVASANGVLYAGASAELIDIDPQGLGMSPVGLQRRLTQAPEVAAVIPVYLGGLAANCADVRRIAGSRIVIEDACHAFGGDYPDGRPVGCGAHADMSVFSFHPVKPITTAEGGAVTTNDSVLAKRLRMFRDHGFERDESLMLDPVREDGSKAPWYFEQQRLGYNYRLSELHAALGLSQLNRVEGFIARRREIARFYDAEFVKYPNIAPLQANPSDRARSALHLYIVHIDWARAKKSRSAVMKNLAERGIGSQVHYLPIYRQPYHRERLAQTPSDFPQAEAYFEGCLSLPLHQALSDEDAERVVRAVADVIAS